MTEMVKFSREKCQTLAQKLNKWQRKKGEQGNLCIKIKKKSWKIICIIFNMLIIQWLGWKLAKKARVLEVVYTAEKLEKLQKKIKEIVRLKHVLRAIRWL